jgi:hypothetical protein
VRNALELAARRGLRLGRAVGSIAMSAFTLSGAASTALKPKFPPWLCVRITQGQTFCTSAL